MRWAARILAAALLALLLGSGAALARDQLVIGVSQFPPTLNPVLDGDSRQGLCARHDAAAAHRLRREMAAHLHALHRAPELREWARGAGDLARRQGGRAAHLYAAAQGHLGRRRAGHHRGCALQLRGRARPALRRQQFRALSPHRQDRGRGCQDLHGNPGPHRLSVSGARRFRGAAGAHRAPGLRRRSPQLSLPHPLRHRPHQSRTLFRPLSRERAGAGEPRGAGAQPHLVGPAAGVRARGGLDGGEHRGSRGKPALRQHRHDRRRVQPDRRRSGPRLRGAPSRPLHRAGEARPQLRARRHQPRQPHPRRSPRAPGAALRHRPQRHQR